MLEMWLTVSTLIKFDLAFHIPWSQASFDYDRSQAAELLIIQHPAHVIASECQPANRCIILGRGVERKKAL